ncbi:MAG: PA14 domain-containing protein [Alphaproteobacteria bacterium]|jgi:hypothetical protein|nr:PA14 domain-containing protein [Alphaproteobacteria bacterium]MDP6817644.1 PA14 domain-containing protein [Alphaproteobacteria bacterium]|tara:strand:- start:193 stop:834 length:642 start_codon:yes stop_codon:yes gene_type:complete
MKYVKAFTSRRAWACLALALSLAISLALHTPAAFADGARPADPQPEASALEPGLAVDYYYLKLEKLDDLYNWLDHKKPDRGAPLANLDFVSGQKGPVLGVDSGALVAAIITGFVRFPESGQFKLLALVNDGMRLWVGQGSDTPILEDPRKLSDRLVGPADITVEADLWYPMKLEYFQKKGTSALVLAWMRPGAGEGEEEVIEAEYLAHLPAAD